MTEWKRVTLQDVTSVLGDGLHGTPVYSDDGEYAFVNGNNLVDGKIVIKKDTKRVDESQYEKYKKPLDERTIMVSINGTLGNVGLYTGEKIILGKSACYFNVKEEYSKNFIRYIVSTPAFKYYLENNSTGTTIKNASLKQMREYEFDIPESFELQEKIAEILKVIDEKIENNNQINRNLSEQGRTLYEELTAGQEPNSILGDLVMNLESGKRPKGGAESEGIPSIGAEKIECFGVYDYSSEKYISNEFFDSLKKGKVLSGDVLLYKDGAYTGKSSMALDGFPHEQCAINEHVFKLNTEGNRHQFFLYYTLNNPKVKEYIYTLASSKAAQPGLNKSELLGTKIILPDVVALSEFETDVNSAMHMIASNAKENRKLEMLRDSLLPKLMSGELDVSEIEV